MDPMPERLAPCPSCGGEECYLEARGLLCWRFGIFCPDCLTEMVGPIRNVLNEARKAVVAAWNNRTEKTNDAGA